MDSYTDVERTAVLFVASWTAVVQFPSEKIQDQVSHKITLLSSPK
jgi:hypothetical protein